MHCEWVGLITSSWPIALILKGLCSCGKPGTMHTHMYGCNGMQELHSCLCWSRVLEPIPCIAPCTCHRDVGRRGLCAVAEMNQTHHTMSNAQLHGVHNNVHQ